MHVLLLTQRLPYAPNRGDRIRAFHLLHTIEQHARVTVASLVHDEDERSQVAAMQNERVQVHTALVPRVMSRLRAVARIPSSRPLTLELLHSPQMRHVLERIVAERPPDVVLAYCSSMARYALESPLNRYPFVLDMVDVDSEKWAALSQTQPRSLRGWVFHREARCLAHFEQQAIRAAAVTICVNERESADIKNLVPDAKVHVVPNGIAVDTFRRSSPPATEPVVVFCGVMNYAPNIEAAVRLARDVWPTVARARPDAQLLLVGADPTPAVRALAGPSIRVTGSVPDVRPYLWQSAVAAAPLLTARGIQNKVLEALAAGLPVVISPAVAEGLPRVVLPGCRVAATHVEIAGQLLELLCLSPDERLRMAEDTGLEGLTWERRLSALQGLLSEAALERRS